MKKNIIIASSEQVEIYCNYCGATVGEISGRTEEKVNAVYDCSRCRVSYCDQCSYGKDVDGKRVQFCLLCDSKIEKVM
ncbi:MAG: hypothetical protein Q9M28_10045 [Mariprofundaceae bacterium]|nr:hypothetical protein [Mariprofundaceae bacterium]